MTLLSAVVDTAQAVKLVDTRRLRTASKANYVHLPIVGDQPKFSYNNTRPGNGFRDGMSYFPPAGSRSSGADTKRDNPADRSDAFWFHHRGHEANRAVHCPYPESHSR